MGSSRKLLVVLAAIAAIALAFFIRSCRPASEPAPGPSTPAVSGSSMTVAIPLSEPVPELSPSPSPKPIPKSVKAASPSVPVPMSPPRVKLHKELIPKDIEIVRVYYAAMITGPGSSIEFDINGSGFTQEFQKMITVESGQPDAQVKNLTLVTPNQIHGTLEISPKSVTRVAFPNVLIADKVVFQAPEPFAVIRPGEVLNLIFTEMGESGRSGRFRVFTNLTQEMFSRFAVTVSTPTIQISDLAPFLPFIVDGTITIGPAVGGDYDISVLLGDKTTWSKKGIVRVVRPNVGQSGLIQKVITQDGYHRPGDTARFSLQGSGFQPGDVNLLKATVQDLTDASAVFSFGSPGRLELALTIPPAAPVKMYELKVTAGEETLQTVPEAFRVVDKNWTRLVKVEPVLLPGGVSTLMIVGRDLTDDFISGIKVETDEPELKLGAFFRVGVNEVSAPISAGASVKPGDYLLKITSNGKPVSPEFGSIIRVSSK